jgi:hypothetical protein
MMDVFEHLALVKASIDVLLALPDHRSPATSEVVAERLARRKSAEHLTASQAEEHLMLLEELGLVHTRAGERAGPWERTDAGQLVAAGLIVAATHRWPRQG